jgi:hypothetical protein
MDSLKLSAGELRAMLKEHKKSAPRLSAKKHELMSYAEKVGLLKKAEVPLPPSPEPEVEKKKMKISKPTVASPVVPATAPASGKKKAEPLPAELKKKPTKKSEEAKKPEEAKKESKGGLAAYTSFVKEKKAAGMSHGEAVQAWKSRQ